jgi:hypothetical protein
MWPELVGRCYKTVYNYGYAGCGNFYIFHKALIELSSVKLTNADTVIIQWTEPLRFDYINNNYWDNQGIGSAELFVKNKVEFLNNESTAILKHLTYMLALAELLSSTKCTWYFMFLSPDSMSHKNKLNLDNEFNTEYSKLVNNLLKYKNNFIDQISLTDFFEIQNSPVTNSQCGTSIFKDDHPTPKYTYMYIKKYLNNYLNLNLTKIKKYSDQSEELIKINKLQHKNILVNNFEILSKVFAKNEK